MFTQMWLIVIFKLGARKAMRKTLGGIKHHWRPVYNQSAVGSTTSTNLQTVLNITGRGKAAVFSGNYKWISERYLQTEVRVDGTATYVYVSSRQNILRADFPFNISIRVRHSVLPGYVGEIRTDVAYWRI